MLKKRSSTGSDCGLTWPREAVMLVQTFHFFLQWRSRHFWHRVSTVSGCFDKQAGERPCIGSSEEAFFQVGQNKGPSHDHKALLTFSLQNNSTLTGKSRLSFDLSGKTGNPTMLIFLPILAPNVFGSLMCRLRSYLYSTVTIKSECKCVVDLLCKTNTSIIDSSCFCSFLTIQVLKKWLFDIYFFFN